MREDVVDDFPLPGAAGSLGRSTRNEIQNFDQAIRDFDIALVTGVVKSGLDQVQQPNFGIESGTMRRGRLHPEEQAAQLLDAIRKIKFRSPV